MKLKVWPELWWHRTFDSLFIDNPKLHKFKSPQKPRQKKVHFFFFFCNSIQFWVCIQINRQKMTQNKQANKIWTFNWSVCATGTNSQMTSFFKWCCVFLFVCLFVCVVCVHSKPHYKINQFFRIFCLDIDLLSSIRNVVNIQKKIFKIW